MKKLLKTVKSFKNRASFIAATAIILMSCTEEKPQPGANVEGETTGKVTILCDEAYFDFLQQPIEMFEKTYPDAEVTFQKAQARQAMGELLSGKAKGIIIGRQYLADEDSLMKVFKVSPHERELIAKDGLVFYTSKNFPLDTLNREQLKSVILSSDAKMKSLFPQLPSEPVFAINNENSSEYANLLKLVTNGEKPLHSFKTFQAADSVKEYVGANANTIGIGYLSQFALDTNFKLLKIGFFHDSLNQYVKPKIVHQAHLVMGNYPYVVPIYSYMLENRRNQPAWGLFTFLARDTEVQRYFTRKGIVPGFGKIELIEQ